MALKTYRHKRDFGVTDEPAGTDRRGHGDAFVVQKHAARRLHYDLGLEIGDVPRLALTDSATPKAMMNRPDRRRNSRLNGIGGNMSTGARRQRIRRLAGKKA